MTETRPTYNPLPELHPSSAPLANALIDLMLLGDDIYKVIDGQQLHGTEGIEALECFESNGCASSFDEQAIVAQAEGAVESCIGHLSWGWPVPDVDAFKTCLFGSLFAKEKHLNNLDVCLLDNDCIASKDFGIDGGK